MLLLLLIGLNFSSPDVPVDYEKGLEAYRANRYEEAKSHFRSFLLSHKEHPLYPDGLYYYGRLELDGEEAKKIFLYLFAHYPDNRWAPYACFMVAKYYYAKDDLERAGSWFRKVISNYPESDLVDSSEVWLKYILEEEGKKWAIQVGAFRDYSNAKTIGLKLKKLGYPVVLVKRKGSETTLWLVRVGYYYERGEALTVQERLEESGYRTYMVEKPCKN